MPEVKKRLGDLGGGVFGRSFTKAGMISIGARNRWSRNTIKDNADEFDSSSSSSSRSEWKRVKVPGLLWWLAKSSVEHQQWLVAH